MDVKIHVLLWSDPSALFALLFFISQQWTKVKSTATAFLIYSFVYCVFSLCETFRVMWRLPAVTGGGRLEHVRISEYRHVWVEPPTHHRSAGRTPHMNVFVPIGIRTHAVRGCVVPSQRPFFSRPRAPLCISKNVKVPSIVQKYLHKSVNRIHAYVTFSEIPIFLTKSGAADCIPIKIMWAK